MIRDSIRIHEGEKRKEQDGKINLLLDRNEQQRLGRKLWKEKKNWGKAAARVRKLYTKVIV